MVSLGDNGAMSMDATFGTNDVKFHLFTLMVFNAHRIGVLMKRPMKITLKNHGLLICANLWHWMIPPSMWKKKRIKTNFKFLHPHGENAYSNGWHNAINHQQNQRRWGLTYRPHQIIVAHYYNKYMMYSPFQCKCSHASRHDISLHQWWTW